MFSSAAQPFASHRIEVVLFEIKSIE